MPERPSRLRDPLAARQDPQPPRRPGPGTRATQLQARVESDGTPEGTHVFLADGTELTQVQSISWDLSAGEPAAVITVRLGLGSIHATGRLELQPAPTPSTPTTRRTP